MKWKEFTFNSSFSRHVKFLLSERNSQEARSERFWRFVISVDLPRATIIEIKPLRVLWLPLLKSLFFTVSFKGFVSLQSSAEIAQRWPQNQCQNIYLFSYTHCHHFSASHHSNLHDFLLIRWKTDSVGRSFQSITIIKWALGLWCKTAQTVCLFFTVRKIYKLFLLKTLKHYF